MRNQEQGSCQELSKKTIRKENTPCKTTSSVHRIAGKGDKTCLSEQPSGSRSPGLVFSLSSKNKFTLYVKADNKQRNVDYDFNNHLKCGPNQRHQIVNKYCA